MDLKHRKSISSSSSSTDDEINLLKKTNALKQEIEKRIRGALSVKPEVLLAPFGSIEKPGAAKVKLVLRGMPVIQGVL